MRKGDVSITYIVAIILGVITITVIIYLLYYHLKNSPINCDECKADYTAWCAECYRVFGSGNWGGGNPMDDELIECAGKCNLLTSSGCDTAAKLFCKPYLPF